MTDQHFDSLSSEDRQAIDRICDRFEEAWRSGNPPDLEEYAGRFSESQAVAGLVELVILDAHYSRQGSRGSSPNEPARSDTQLESASADTSSGQNISSEELWREYVRRFPQLADVGMPSEWIDAANRPPIDRRFRPVRSLAAGGLGRISIAEDLQIGRTVAIKEMHARFAASPDHQRRFIREAEITGRLEHPCIVPVYSLGKQHDGQPYYAMRMIEGRSLGKATHELHASAAQRPEFQLQLRQFLTHFTDICQAVEYAHSKGVIHRDIKPDNIMLGDYGEAFLVDWGLAKKLGEPDAASLMQMDQDPEERHTQEGVVMGTPHFMSPEQAAGGSHNVDARSDVYSLGATLFFLLTDHVPPRIASASHPAGANGHIDAGPLRDASTHPALRAICAKAMAAAPLDRYSSAKQLADDLERFLADAPTSAYADPLMTRCRRWLQNHRALTGAMIATSLLAMLGLAAFTWLANRNANALSAKNQQLDRLLEEEIQLRQVAEVSEQRTSDAMNYLVNVMRSPDPNRLGRDVKVTEVLDRATVQLEEELTSDPLMQARLLEAIGRTYLGLDLAKRSLALSEKAYVRFREHVGENNRLTLGALYLKCRAMQRLADDKALSLAESLLRRHQDQLGSNDPDTLLVEQTVAALHATGGNAQLATRSLQSILPRVIAQHGEQSPEVLTTMNELAVAYHLDGRDAEASQLAERIYNVRKQTQGPNTLATLTAGSNHAQYLLSLGNTEGALAEYESLLQRARDRLGDEHFLTLIIMNRLGTCYLNQNDLSRAVPLIEESLEVSQSIYGDRHPRTISAANSLGNVYLAAGDYSSAIPQYEQVYRHAADKHGATHSQTLTIGNNLASAYRLNKQFDDAVRLFETTHRLQERELGNHHPQTLLTMVNLVAALQESGKPTDAKPQCQSVHELTLKHLGEKHPLTHTAMSLLGSNQLMLKDYQAAKSTLQRCLELRAASIPDHWLRFHTMSLLGEAYFGLKELDQAESLLLEAFRQMNDRRTQIPARAENRLRQAASRLVRLYKAKQLPEKADAYRAAASRSP